MSESSIVSEWACPACGTKLLVVASQARIHIDNCDGGGCDCRDYAEWGRCKCPQLEATGGAA